MGGQPAIWPSTSSSAASWPPVSWKGSEATWKDWAAWVPNKSPRCMGFFDRQDLPFYYALADAFTHLVNIVKG